MEVIPGLHSSAAALRYVAAEGRQAEEVWAAADFLLCDGSPRSVTEVVPGESGGPALAIVVPELLSAEECAELVNLADEHGLERPWVGSSTLRTSRRTKMYENEELAERVKGRLPEAEALRGLHGLHANWRVVCYGEGEVFPAHRDQSDTLQIRKDDGSKELAYSSHTLLVSLEEPESGGETRFYPRGDYGYAVDVRLPRGYGLIFSQSLLHAGQPVQKGRKYVAQAGVLKLLEDGQRFRPNIFNFGPGLKDYAHESAAHLMGLACPILVKES